MVTEKKLSEPKNKQKVGLGLLKNTQPVANVLNQLRARLLDITSRNRLINFKLSKYKSIEFVNKPNLPQVFDRLMEGKSFRIKPIPDPPPLSCIPVKPDAKTYAQSIGIDISSSFSESSCVPQQNCRSKELQAIHYPTDLDKICRKIKKEAQTIIEESGTNMLFLIFGYLEFYADDHSDKPQYAPLLAVPIVIERKGIDRSTSTYTYEIIYSGEDVQGNFTLQEKLKKEFLIQFPDFDIEVDNPLGALFFNVKNSIISKPRWKIDYRLSIGFLSFGKLAIWDDINPEKWPFLLNHEILKSIIQGEGNDFPVIFSDCYNIDNHPDGDLPLVFDADSSQHSAIIDVLDGKNLVINGPPGTGKSQTIANIISVGISRGKKILFVSDKLAALEVVKRKLDEAHLGHFCLELHSHKTRKMKLLHDLDDRLHTQFTPPTSLNSKISILKRHKVDLNRYSEIMSQVICNKLGLSVYNVFWRTEHFKRKSDVEIEKFIQLKFSEATEWNLDDIEFRKSCLLEFGQHYLNVSEFGISHPFEGFIPKQLIPGDEITVLGIFKKIKNYCLSLIQAVNSFRSILNETFEPCISELLFLNIYVRQLPPLPADFVNNLFQKLFSEHSEITTDILMDFEAFLLDLKEYARLKVQFESTFLPLDNNDLEQLIDYIYTNNKRYLQINSEITLPCLIDDFNSMKSLFLQLKDNIKEIIAPPSSLDSTVLNQIDVCLNNIIYFDVSNFSFNDISDFINVIRSEIDIIQKSLLKLQPIINKYDLNFEFTSANIAKIFSSKILMELQERKGNPNDSLGQAEYYLESFPGKMCISDLKHLKSKLSTINTHFGNSLKNIGKITKQVGIKCPNNFALLDILCILSQIASQAPKELLKYRHVHLLSPHIDTHIQKAKKDLDVVMAFKNHLTPFFDLDSLPSRDQLQRMLNIFQKGDSLLNIIKSEWKNSKRSFHKFCKSTEKLKTKDYVDFLTYILQWIDCDHDYRNNITYKQYFGVLFKGTDTDFNKIEKLREWLIDSRIKLSRFPSLNKSIDPVALDSKILNSLSTRSDELTEFQSKLNTCFFEYKILIESSLISADIVNDDTPFHSFNSYVSSSIARVDSCINFFDSIIDSKTSLHRAIELLKVYYELLNAKDDVFVLTNGIQFFFNKILKYCPLFDTFNDRNIPVFLNKFESDIANLCELSKHLKKYCKRDLSISKLRTIISDFETLNCRLARIDGVFLNFNCSEWDLYVSIIDQLFIDFDKTIDFLIQMSIPGKKCNEILYSLNSYAELKNLTNKYCTNNKIKLVLGELYKGLLTNPVSLSSTYLWGKDFFFQSNTCADLLKTILRNENASSIFLSVVDTLCHVQSLYQDICQSFTELDNFGNVLQAFWNITPETFPSVTASGLLTKIEYILQNSDTLISWSRYQIARQLCVANNLDKIVDALESQGILPGHIIDIFEFILYNSISKEIFKKYPELLSFSSNSHNRKKADFVTYDKEILQLNGLKIAYDIDISKTIPPGYSGPRASDKTEMSLLLNEIGKKKRHIPIRQLLKRAGKSILSLKPCFMMGPLSVAQYLDKNVLQFDLVIMDEASQLKPEDALGAIARGKQLVVVGDPKQLPPTNFFDRIFDEADDDEELNFSSSLSESESILDICQQVFHPVRTLRWHYRSKHESLISFSNNHFYDSKLLLFPSPFQESNELGIKLHYFNNGIYKDRQNIFEATRIVNSIIFHMMKRLHESLGVVTLNQRQRELIDEILDKKLREIPDVSKYIDKWENLGLPFFVKNLENVQGDERDVIFISTTFGKSQGSSVIRQNFGPISRPNGWRRLNVLFTRSRKRVELFTSMKAEDIIIDEKTPSGTAALKNYLDFAQTGILPLTTFTHREPDSDFEISVGNALKDSGFDIVPQLGVSGYFIDLAIRNPDRPGEFLAALECDGATYHSSNSARDRDKIRQNILESLGWKDKIWRIWSTDWFSNSRREFIKLLHFLEERRKISLLESTNDDHLFLQDSTDSQYPVDKDNSNSDSIEFYSDELDLFVEVGDSVSYYFLDKPKNPQAITIVETKSDPSSSLINEFSPLAKTLLGMSIGEEEEFSINDNLARKIKIINIIKKSHS